MIKKWWVLVSLMALPLACGAEDLYTKRYAICIDDSGGVTVEMLDCIASEVQAQDARLNSTYRKLSGKLSPARKKELVAAQRLWVQYRDANCGFYSGPDGGTRADLAINGCLLRMTAERAQELQTLAETEDD